MSPDICFHNLAYDIVQFVNLENDIRLVSCIWIKTILKITFKKINFWLNSDYLKRDIIL